MGRQIVRAAPPPQAKLEVKSVKASTLLAFAGPTRGEGETGVPPGQGSAPGGGAGQGDTYSERLLKLIPAETVAAYMFLDGLLRSALKSQESQLTVWLWAVFAVIGAGNVLYLKQALKVTSPVQYGIMTAAYAVWVFSIGGPFGLSAWYQPFMGSVALALFTFLAPRLYMGEQTA